MQLSTTEEKKARKKTITQLRKTNSFSFDYYYFANNLNKRLKIRLKNVFKSFFGKKLSSGVAMCLHTASFFFLLKFYSILQLAAST